jgi:hypothetical protein
VASGRKLATQPGDGFIMLSFGRLILGLLMILLSSAIQAGDIIHVNAMNYPAWVIRNHQTLALTPGHQLSKNDLIRTGKKGRVLLQLADGSAIKLGESARFLIESANIDSSQNNSILRSTLQVLRGAFRFTSSFFKQTAIEHDLRVAVGAITIGIRGTDIWGRSDMEKDLVALIEGNVTVNAKEEPGVNLNEALNYVVKPKGQAILPVEQVDPDQLNNWAFETELSLAQGIATASGEWSIVLISLSTLNGANRALKNFHQQGFAVKRKSVIRNGRTLHRLLLPGFKSIEDAMNARGMAADLLGINDAWVWRQG